MCKVLNKKNTSENGVYIGRPTKWGNPFIIGKDGDRAEVIRKFEEYYLNSPRLQMDIGELRGKNLICWCSPEACHGDVLLKYANA